MKILVWQWGRRGAGPRYAADLAGGLRGLPGTEVFLSLSTGAEIMRGDDPPSCQLPVPTYAGYPSLLARLARMPWLIGPLVRRLRAMNLDMALCAMPAALDLMMVTALRRAGVPYVVVIHDADPHPGDRPPLQALLQRRLVRRAAGLVALSGHVGARLRAQGVIGPRALIVSTLPPLTFGPPPAPPGSHAGARLRLLSFGRLLPYKGLDLLADALAMLGARADLEVRVVGSGPESKVLAALRRLPGVTVENRWVPEAEVGALLGWADALVLPYREASQSGVASAAVAAGRWVVATRVGGLSEQLGHETLAIMCEPNAASLADGLCRLLEQARAVPARVVAGDARQEWRNVAAQLVGQLQLPGSPSGLRLRESVADAVVRT